MKLKKFIISSVFFLSLLGSINQLLGQELSAREIISRADEKSRGKTSQSAMTMNIIRPNWSRSVSLKMWSKESDYSLVYITAPAKEKGQVFLKRENDMWNWVPAIERLIKIPPSMMMQSWMGSDFTNDDLVKESSVIVDYNHTLIGKELLRGQECYKIELLPLPDAAVTWGKVISWITIKGFNQWKAEYYNEDMELVNTMNAYDIKKMDDREIPVRLEMEPVNKKGQKTVLIIDLINFDNPIDNSFFSQQNMKRISDSE